MEEAEDVRRLQFTGKSTFIVSLPKQWIRDLGLKQGDQVRIVRQASSVLHLYPPKARPVRQRQGDATVRIGAGEKSPATVRRLISLYFLGFKTIHVRPKSGRLTAAQRTSIKHAARRMLMGAEVISDSGSGVTIQVLVDFKELTVDGAFKRMLHLAKSMLVDAVEAMRDGNEALARDVIGTDDEVDRFGFYIIRQLKTAIESEHMLGEIGFDHARNCLGYRLVAKNIERTGDHAVRIARDVIEFKGGVGADAAEEIRGMAEYAIRVLNDACLALFKKDYDLAESTIRAAGGIASSEAAVLRLAGGRAGPAVYRIRRTAEDIRRIAEYASDISEIVLNMTVEKSLKKR